MSGRDFVTAMVLGFEAECRIARAVQPQLGAVGWHPTGAAGVFGAAIATAKVLGLDEVRLCHTIGLAATQPVGVREMFGSMTKSFHPGRAAQNGLLAALLAERGYTSSPAGIEAKRGWANVVSSRHNLEVITEGLGQSYEILRNTYKPFACGLVVHPVIDGCIELRNAHNLEVELIEKIDLDVNPLVLELTSKKKPVTGLEGKFSVYCVAALAIVAGRAGEAEFADTMVRNPVIVELCDRVTATADPRVGKDQARVRIQLKDGRVLEHFVEHAVGSLQKPMSDAALEGKFLDLAEGIMPTSQARRLIELCKVVDTLEDVGEIGRAGAVS
jgi:2-methylcitrate dehydratase PrpD